MAASNITALPNPFTPMAYLAPPLATKITNQNYVAIGSLAVLLWDTISYLHEDYRLATGFRINLSFIIYCIARVASLAYLMGLVVLTTIPIANCDYIHYITMLYPFTTPLAILPFVTRVSALYAHKKIVIAFFSATWLAVLGSCIYVPIGTSGQRIGTSQYCVEFKTRMANELQVICPFVHDTLIFIATARALMKYSYSSDTTVKTSIRVLILGKLLPRFSKTILRDGQFYYLATLILNVFFIVLAHIPKRPLTPCSISYLVFVMLNVMSSYVYRNIRLGFYQDYSITSSTVDKALQMPRVQMQPSRHRDIVFNHPVSTKHLEVGIDLEDGYSDIIKTEVKGVEADGSTDSNLRDQTSSGNMGV